MKNNSFNEDIKRKINEEECHLSSNLVWRYNIKLKEFKLKNQLEFNFF